MKVKDSFQRMNILEALTVGRSSFNAEGVESLEGTVLGRIDVFDSCMFAYE